MRQQSAIKFPMSPRAPVASRLPNVRNIRLKQFSQQRKDCRRSVDECPLNYVLIGRCRISCTGSNHIESKQICFQAERAWRSSSLIFIASTKQWFEFKPANNVQRNKKSCDILLNPEYRQIQRRSIKIVQTLLPRPSGFPPVVLGAPTSSPT